MSIPNYIQPTPDFSQGYIVTPDDWNNNFDGITAFFNTQVVPAINALLAAPAPNVGAQSFFNARMTASAGVPFPTADVAGTGTIYLTACSGNLIGIYDTGNSSWSNFALTSDLVLSVPAGTRDLFDVFVYNNLGSLALTTSPYHTQAVSNNPAAGANIVCNVASTTNLAIGDVISITDGSNQQEAAITALVPNTSVTLDYLKTAFTAPTIRTAVPTVAVTTVAGVPVLSSDNGKRYVCTILVVNNQVWDTKYHRGIGNAYNRIIRPLYINAPAGYSQATGDRPADDSIVLGEHRAVVITPNIHIPTPWNLRNQKLTTGTPNPVYAQLHIDGVKHLTFGYTQVTSKMFCDAAGVFFKFGRHIMQEWFNNASGGAVPINALVGGGETAATVGHCLN